MERIGGQSITIQLAVWAEGDGAIRVTGQGIDARIKNDPARPSGHPTLYRQLENVMKVSGTRAA